MSETANDYSALLEIHPNRTTTCSKYSNRTSSLLDRKIFVHTKSVIIAVMNRKYYDGFQVFKTDNNSYVLKPHEWLI